MADDRASRVWSSISATARREGTPVTLRHVCLACVDGVAVAGAGLSIGGHLAGLRESVYATDKRSEELEDLQSTLGEGPGVDALDGHGAVLVPDLTARDSETRWPMFTPAAEERGVKAMFALPIRAGAARVGVLDLYGDEASDLDGAQLADALAYADAALSLTLDLHGGITPNPARTVDQIFNERPAEVHQASGMMSVQLGVSVADTFVELADTLVAEFDVIDFLDMLTNRAVALLGVKACGVVLIDHLGTLNVVGVQRTEPAARAVPAAERRRAVLRRLSHRRIRAVRRPVRGRRPVAEVHPCRASGRVRGRAGHSDAAAQ